MASNPFSLQLLARLLAFSWELKGSCLHPMGRSGDNQSFIACFLKLGYHPFGIGPLENTPTCARYKAVLGAGWAWGSWLGGG